MHLVWSIEKSRGCDRSRPGCARPRAQQHPSAPWFASVTALPTLARCCARDERTPLGGLVGGEERAIFDQPIPIIALARLIAEILDEPLHVGDGHPKGGAGLADDVLLDHNAAQVVRAIFQ